MHYEFYEQLRSEFPQAGSQLIIRGFAHVAGDMAREKTQYVYRSNGALKLDKRLYTFKSRSIISLWTVNGRDNFNMKLTKYHQALIFEHGGQAEIIQDRVSKDFFFVISIGVDEEEIISPIGVIGVDKGIVNLATTSTRRNFSGAQVEAERKKYWSLKKRLQAKGTRSAKRKLSKLKKKESRFKKDVNHQISKQIVEEAKGTLKAISLEDLTGISKRATVKKEQRARHKGWSFFQLDSFIKYKAQRAGVSVIFVDPAYTSQQCPHCGTTTRKNRKVRDIFKCISCDFTEDADIVGAINIASKGATDLQSNINHPIVEVA